MRVIGPIGQRPHLVELAVRRAQPALRQRRVWIDRTLELDLAAVWRIARAASCARRLARPCTH